MANKTTFWSFLKNNYIEIPIIQRDYAQGRLGKENLRKNFLGDLKRALDKEPPYKETEMKLGHSCISPWQYNHVIQRS